MTEAVNGGAAVSIRGVVKRFGSLVALDGVDLEIGRGEFFGLLGPNGAGKTTLISSLAGLVRPDAGNLSVMGHDVVGDYRNARRLLGVVPQELLYDPFFTVRETLVFQSGYFGIESNDDWIDEILDALDLTAKADTGTRHLSGGMKRRLLVGQALVHRPPVIVLDEPTAGVDVELRQSLWAFIRRLNGEGHTIILTTHYLEEAEALCGRIAMLKQGRIIALDRTENLLARFSGPTLSLTLPEGAQLPPELAERVEPGPGVRFRLDAWGEVETILANLRRAGIVPLEMETGQPDLEQVFMRIMGEGRAQRPEHS